MGDPVILRIISDDQDSTFYAECASPEKFIPEFARFVEDCKANKIMPTATAYAEYVVTAEGDHVREYYPTDADEPENLAHRYVVRTTAAGDGWLGDLTIWSRQKRTDRDPILTVWHRETFSSTDTRSLHRLALGGLKRTIASVHALNRPRITAPALREWMSRAAWHARQAETAAA
ncbi:hypothetical protein ACQPXM_41435 (plasmid) [Kribbella sp. CA-253562]|uniref:hypothetical protein n=1 Tax=Kribbella sp. CA-253562 TaxID=3239942 RepID=UPI003D8F3740